MADKAGCEMAQRGFNGPATSQRNGLQISHLREKRCQSNVFYKVPASASPQQVGLRVRIRCKCLSTVAGSQWGYDLCAVTGDADAAAASVSSPYSRANLSLSLSWQRGGPPRLVVITA